jgi:CNT family concentrative nucleoside transporter
MGRLTGLLGLAVILAVAWLLSTHRKSIKLRIVLWGLGLQLAFALLVLKTPFRDVVQKISAGVAAMFKYAEAGSTFVFGKLGAYDPRSGSSSPSRSCRSSSSSRRSSRSSTISGSCSRSFA